MVGCKTAEVPLVVDLDGTLVKSDTLIESVLILIKRNPLSLVAIFFWLCKGRAYVKQQVGRRADLDVSSLPYNVDLLIDLRILREQGRCLVLATGADEHTAGQIAGYLNLFQQVIASDGLHNLTGSAKRDRLVAEFGQKGFDYAGNSRQDVIVWHAARHAIVVNAVPAVEKTVSAAMPSGKVYARPHTGIKPLFRALRPHQWLKNSLVFLPLVAAHRIPEMWLIIKGLLAFTAFCLCASSVYVLNDLLDLSEDRRHPRKRKRPFASGALTLEAGLVMAPVLLALSLLPALLLPMDFLSVLAVYYGLTILYTFYVKKIVMLDVIFLAGLFTVRMMAGSAAVAIWPSHWLLAFSMFLFVSLALVKRYAELVIVQNERGRDAKARGYMVRDRELLAAMGIASGFLSILVLALYITSGAAKAYYGQDSVIWMACPLMFFWVSHIWIIAHRGNMVDDPLVFALRDPMSWVVFVLLLIIMVIAI